MQPEVPGQELLRLTRPSLLAQRHAGSVALRWPRRGVLRWCLSLPCDPSGARREDGSAFLSSVSWSSLDSLEEKKKKKKRTQF